MYKIIIINADECVNDVSSENDSVSELKLYDVVLKKVK
jgi:hypothetical protein